jgi:ATP-dependent Clp protease ATP-binding subunit ClpB
MTSNIGFNKKIVGFNNDNSKIISMLKDELDLSFVNRIDKNIIFNKLTKNDIKKIIDKELEKMVDKFKEKNIIVNINSKVRDSILEESMYKEYGARKIKKIIVDKIESIIIDSYIEKNIKDIAVDYSNMKYVTI